MKARMKEWVLRIIFRGKVGCLVLDSNVIMNSVVPLCHMMSTTWDEVLTPIS